MADHLTLVSIAEGAIVTQFIDLAEVVQNRSRYQQIPVNPFVMACHEAAEPDQREAVLKQTAKVGMVHGLCRRRPLELPCRLLVPEDILQQATEPGITKLGDKSDQLAKHLLDVEAGRWKVLAQIDFLRLARTHSVDGDLEVVAV